MPDITVLPGQHKLLSCDAGNILYCAGVGAGKTIGGALWTMTQMVQYPGVVGLVGAPSYNQLARVSLPSLLRLLGDCGIKFTYGKKPPEDWGVSRYPEHERVLSVCVPGSDRPAQALCYTMDDPDALRGISIGYAWIDEATSISPEAYNVVLSRLRGQPEGTKYRTLLTTTPSGFNWIYRRFVENPVPDSAVIRSATTDNPYLPPGFVEQLRAQYSEAFARQELEAVFLNLTSGAAYYGFNRSKNVAATKLDPLAPMWYSLDINVSPLCSVYGQHDKKSFSVIGEIYIVGSGKTADAAQEFCTRLAGHQNKKVVVYGDQSGNNRDTRNDSTDYDVADRVMKANGWSCEVRRNYKNPALIESVEAVNAAFEHGRGVVDPSCKRLITDFEQCCWAEGTRVLDKSNKDLTHLSDAARYFVYKEFNVKQQVSSSDLLN